MPPLSRSCWRESVTRGHDIERNGAQSTLERPSHRQAYSLWIFDRHCEPIYYQDWSHLYRTPSAASGTASSFTSSLSSTFQRVGGTVPDQEKRDASTTTHKRARGDALPGVSQQVQTQDDEPVDTQALPFDQEAKLIYGVVYSLRNMVRKLGGSYVYLPSTHD